MAYTAPNIKDRVAVGDDLYTMTEVDGKVKLIPSPTQVVEPGTPINKEFLQPLCDAVENMDFNDLLNKPELAAVATSGRYEDLIDKPLIATGSYVGDGTGAYNVKATINSVVANSRLDYLGATPREIELPFSPNVLLLIEETSREILVVTSAISIKPFITGWASRRVGNTSSGTGVTVQANDSVIALSGNKLQLISTATATQVVDGSGQGASVSFSSPHLYSSKSDSTDMTTYNQAGYTYHYIAF